MFRLKLPFADFHVHNYATATDFDIYLQQCALKSEWENDRTQLYESYASNGTHVHIPLRTARRHYISISV